MLKLCIIRSLTMSHTLKVVISEIGEVQTLLRQTMKATLFCKKVPQRTVLPQLASNRLFINCFPICIWDYAIAIKFLLCKLQGDVNRFSDSSPCAHHPHKWKVCQWHDQLLVIHSIPDKLTNSIWYCTYLTSKVSTERLVFYHSAASSGTRSQMKERLHSLGLCKWTRAFRH